MTLDEQTTLNSPIPDDIPDADTTLTFPSAAPAQPASPQQVDRFRLERLLGQGGMGQVWEARDPQLERQVAIKRLLSTDPQARKRFLREARLQATIVHPGICPVFEVGQAAGEPYLVMPRLDGASLDQAVDGAPLEYKLELMRQVAEAAHAAHQQGLIHRDLKPANILVESPPDAAPRPVVLDFGIARPMEGEGLTASGEIVGTPAYMAPEQVEGKSLLLDRRTDVYALGATLYRLLVGHPPHTGTGTPLLFSIMHEEPARMPLGDIPAEVEAIVFKCLEKKKSQRYDSARLLAEDLGRYLAGEPVEARSVTRWIRLNKWLKRHRVAVRVTAAAALVAIAALAWGGWSAWRSEERQEIARQFGAQIEEIEALARYSHLVPLHDVREDQKQLRARLDAIRPSLDDRDPVVRALANHALGRGHLALDELKPARDFLQTAYDLNPENPEIAADLGRTLSELYRARLATVEGTRDLGGRDSLRKQISSSLNKTFRKPAEKRRQWQVALADPARDLLARRGNSQTADSVEFEALTLFHEGDPQAALDLLISAPKPPLWAYERLRLEGDIRRSWAVTLADTVETRQEAKRQLETARQIYGRALAVAPSHAAILRDDAQTVSLLIKLGLAERAEVEPLVAEALAALDKARTVHPENFRTWLWIATLELLVAEHQIDTERDPTEHLDRALRASRKAIEINSQSSAAWQELGETHKHMARWHGSRGTDVTTEFEQAFQALDQIAVEERDFDYYISLGSLHFLMAGHTAEQGHDAAGVYQQAIAAFRSAAKIHSAPFSALTNLGATIYQAADVDGSNPQTMLHQAIEIMEQASALRPDHIAPHYYLGLSRTRLAQEGDSLRFAVDERFAQLAQTNFENAIEVDPEAIAPWIGLAELFHLRAIAAHRRGGDSAALFARARQAHTQALELAPDQPIVLLNAAWTAYFEGKFALRAGFDPTSKLAKAEALCQRTLEIRRRPSALLCLGSVRRIEAEYRLLGHNKVDAAAALIGEAEQIFEEIIDLDSKHAEAHRSLGRLLTIEAQRLRLAGKDASSALLHARRVLDQSLELEDSLIDFHLADARWYFEKALWLQANDQEFSDVVNTGQNRLATVFEAREKTFEARRLYGEFDFLAQSTIDDG